MSAIVFLDIDGVLNGNEWLREGGRLCEIGKPWPMYDPVSNINPVAVALLNGLIEESNADVVISSSWRHYHPGDQMQAILGTRGFRGRIIGHTPKMEDEGRHVEIRTWLTIRGHMGPWVALDDFDMRWALKEKQVLTNNELGLTAADVARARMILGR